MKCLSIVSDEFHTVPIAFPTCATNWSKLPSLIINRRNLLTSNHSSPDGSEYIFMRNENWIKIFNSRCIWLLTDTTSVYGSVINHQFSDIQEFFVHSCIFFNKRNFHSKLRTNSFPHNQLSFIIYLTSPMMTREIIYNKSDLNLSRPFSSCTWNDCASFLVKVQYNILLINLFHWTNIS